MSLINNIKHFIGKVHERCGKKCVYASMASIAVISIVVWSFASHPVEDAGLNFDEGDRAINRSPAQTAGIPGDGDYEYTEASGHIGEKAKVRGTVLRVFTAKSGVTFFDFCEPYDDCPFSAVVFASDQPKFGDLSRYDGRSVILTGVIKSYNGQAEMVLSSPDQVTER